MKQGLIVLVLWTLIVFGVLLAPIGEMEIPIFREFRHWDKVCHFSLFAVTGFVGIFSAKFLSLFRYRMLFGIVFGLVLALCSEFAQSLIPCRDMSLYDLLADVVGLGVALALYAFLYYRTGLRTFFRL